MNNPHMIRAYNIGTAPTLLDDIRLEVYTCIGLCWCPKIQHAFLQKWNYRSHAFCLRKFQQTPGAYPGPLTTRSSRESLIFGFLGYLGSWIFLDIEWISLCFSCSCFICVYLEISDQHGLDTIHICHFLAPLLRDAEWPWYDSKPQSHWWMLFSKVARSIIDRRRVGWPLAVWGMLTMAQYEAVC